MMTDMAARSHRYMQMFPDDEQRVFYVAATRAKSGLNIIQPQSLLFFEILPSRMAIESGEKSEP